MKLIIIHGAGGTFADAIRHVQRCFDITCDLWHGDYYVDRAHGPLVRHLLAAAAPDRYTAACQELIAARFLAAEAPDRGPPDEGRTTRISGGGFRRNFMHLGLPATPAAQRRRAQQLAGEAGNVLEAIAPRLVHLQTQLTTPDGTQLPEAHARELVRSVAAHGDDGGLAAFLESLRDMQETGGDLDTVASAALYAYAVIREAQANGVTLQYGRDCRFVFINYHQDFRHLAAYAPAEVYAADLPIGAFPSFGEDAVWLRRRDVRIARFEDHHPCTPEQRAMLESLRDDGTIGALALTGPRQGEEPDPAHLSCAADMVYTSTVHGKAWDNASAQLLCELAHREDFVTGRDDRSRTLTDLVKGGACKIELAQALLNGLTEDALEEAFARHGWAAQAATMTKAIANVTDALAENLALLDVAPGAGSGAAPAPSRVLMALAPLIPAGQTGIPVGKAVDFYARTIPDVDYVFYCYGASLMVARRVNSHDTFLNLGELMGRIGTASDGGHAGAAVCRPELNPSYPTRLLGRVSGTNFGTYVRYMARRLDEAGLRVTRCRMLSQAQRPHMRRAGKQLVAVLVIAMLAGLALTALFPAFRPTQIEESNRDFMHYLEQPETTEVTGDAE